jgi:hypothetical protein
MDRPPEFVDFCRLFHQDIFLLYPKIEDAIDTTLKSFNSAQRAVLGEFITSLLREDISDAELGKFFTESGADFYLNRAGNFFREVLKHL